MAELYVASMACYRPSAAGKVEIYHTAAYCVAVSKDEAFGKSVGACQFLYPKEQGYLGHDVTVGVIPRHEYPPEASGG